MSEKIKHKFRPSWTVIGRFPDYETASIARGNSTPAGFQSKIHKQEQGFAVKIRPEPKDEAPSSPAAKEA